VGHEIDTSGLAGTGARIPPVVPSQRQGPREPPAARPSPVLETSVSDRVQRLRDVSRLILDAIERDDLPAMERHVNESERLVAQIAKGLSEHRSESSEESRGLLDHIRRMNAGMIDSLRERQDAIVREIGRARSFWHRVRDHHAGPAGGAGSLDRES
jgi:hypothetical protein